MINPIAGNSPRIHPADPRFRKAIDELHQAIGMRVNDVLLPTHWAVVEINGLATVVINEDGMRAFAMIHPNPDAPSTAERLIAAMSQTHEHRGQT